MALFGNDDIKASGWSNFGGYIIASKYALVEEGMVESISVYMGSVGGNVRMAIYADNAGVPGALQCETGIAAAALGWNTLIPTTLPTLSAGSYWLAFQASDPLDQIRYAAGTPNQACYVAHVWGSFPTPFGTPDEYVNRDFSAYCTYAPVGVGGYTNIF